MVDRQDVNRMARTAGDHPIVENGARAGYAGNGVLHLLLAWIAVQVAIGHSGKSADQSGALSMLTEHGWGKALLWLITIGCALLAVWQLTEAILRSRSKDGASDAIKAAAKCVVYTVLAWTAGKFATGGSSSSKKKSTDLTASLLSHGWGKALIVLAGLAVIAVGGYHVYKGWKQKFLGDLEKNPGQWATWAGRIGYIAKGIALIAVGVFLALAALRNKASDGGGLDTALRGLRDLPAGTVLLLFVALGLAAYGVYSFARARFARV